MKAIKIVAVVLVLLVVVVVGVGFLLPKEVVVTRHVTIDAPPADIMPHLIAPKKLLEWSPWADRDPNAEWTFEGPESGVGAKYSWSGNRDVGTGSQEITKIVENERVETALDFGEQGPATAWLELEPRGEQTKVTWGLRTEMAPPIATWFGLFMDGLIGPDYEQGLANLKSRVEG